MIDRRDSKPPAKQTEPDAKQKPRPRLPRYSWLILLAVMVLFNVLFYSPGLRGGKPAQGARIQISYSDVASRVQSNQVRTARVSATTISGDFVNPYRDPQTGKTYTRYTANLLPVPDLQLVPLLKKHHVQISAQIDTPPPWLQALQSVLGALPLLFLLGLFFIGARSARMQQQSVFGFGKSRAKRYSEERPSTTFEDVAGVDTAKQELQEVVDFLRNPDKYLKLGARIPRGALLLGPPGTGKTLLARAVAGEAGVPFFSISSSEFVEMFVGVGASRVRDLFQQARTASPSIIFIDEIDAIGRQRAGGASFGGGSNDEREQTLNQILVEMDGFDNDTKVIVLASTNRPDVLDIALMRPGRFDRQVTVDPPDRRGREAILRVHTRKLPLARDVDLAALAQATPGMTGADLANLVNEAALVAARRGADQVGPDHFNEALDRIVLGAPGSPLMNKDERRIVAYHEGGHALAALLLPHADPVHRVTITPRGRSLGVTQFRPLDDRRNYRRDYLLDRLVIGLSGRAAEEVACEDITSGAQDDLKQVTAMARTMVTQLGMAPEVGLGYFGGRDDVPMAARAYGLSDQLPYSEETAEEIDTAVERLIDEAHKRSVTLLEQNRETLDVIAAALLQDESLDSQELAAIIGSQQAKRLEEPRVAAQPLAAP